jgi:hypothetical protein
VHTGGVLVHATATTIPTPSSSLPKLSDPKFLQSGDTEIAVQSLLGALDEPVRELRERPFRNAAELQRGPSAVMLEPSDNEPKLAKRSSLSGGGSYAVLVSEPVSAVGWAPLSDSEARPPNRSSTAPTTATATALSLLPSSSPWRPRSSPFPPPKNSGSPSASPLPQPPPG